MALREPDEADRQQRTARIEEVANLCRRGDRILVGQARSTKAASIRGSPRILRENRSLSAMSRAHREILHLARLLGRVVEDLPTEKVDCYLIRDAQRVIGAIETLVRMHTAQEEDIYEAAAARTVACLAPTRDRYGTSRRGSNSDRMAGGGVAQIAVEYSCRDARQR
jgi:hypothetical protein